MGIRVPEEGEKFGDEFIVTKLIRDGVKEYNKFAKDFHESFDATQPRWEQWSHSGQGYATLFYVSRVGY